MLNWAQSTVQTLTSNLSTVLDKIDTDLVNAAAVREEQASEELASLQGELETYMRLLDDAQMQQVEMSKQTRLIVAEKDAELKALREAFSNKTINSDFQSSSSGHFDVSGSELHVHVLEEEKGALLEHIHHVEERLRSSLRCANDTQALSLRCDDLLRKYCALKAECDKKNDSIDSLAMEYSQLACECDTAHARDSKRIEEVMRENEVLATKIGHFEHNIVEMADRAAADAPGAQGSGSSKMMQELREARSKIVNLQFDLKEKEQALQAVGGAHSPSKARRVDEDATGAAAALAKAVADVERAQAEKAEAESLALQRAQSVAAEFEVLRRVADDSRRAAAALEEQLEGLRGELRGSREQAAGSAAAERAEGARCAEQLRQEKSQLEAQVASLGERCRQDARVLADKEAALAELRAAVAREAALAESSAARERAREAELQALQESLHSGGAESAVKLEELQRRQQHDEEDRERGRAASAAEKEALRQRLEAEMKAAVEQQKSDDAYEMSTSLEALQQRLEAEMKAAVEQQKSDAAIELLAALADQHDLLAVKAATQLQHAEEEGRSLVRQTEERLAERVRVAEEARQDAEARLGSVEERFEARTREELAAQRAALEQEHSGMLQTARAAAQALVDAAAAEKQEYLALYSRESRLRKALHNKLVELQGNIRVICRVRPVLDVEVRSGQHDDITAYTPGSTDDLIVQKDSATRQRFEFDRVFKPSSPQQELFDAVQPLCSSVLDGFNATIFAYGQTGSGKTYTMEGAPSDPGISPRAVRALFETAAGYENWAFTFMFSMLEIYNESILDLLDGGAAREKLEIRQGPEGNVVAGLTEVAVHSPEQVAELMARGQANRAVGSHDMNEHSSRSHSILTINVRGANSVDGGASSGRLHLIDLAGSERVSKTDASGDRLKEAQNINRSLSALGDVINALGNRKASHVPYRNSKLTFLLQDSLGGSSKVLMFVTVSPASYNAVETVCSLNFAARCRSVELGLAKANKK